MKRKVLTVLCIMLFALFIVAAPDVYAAAKSNAWDAGKKEIEVKGAFTFYSHPSKDGKEAWIYNIKIKGKKNKSLSIPKTIRGKKVTRLGTPDDMREELCITLFGGHIEPWHDYDASYNNAATTLRSIKIPDTVEVIENSSFSGLNSLKTIKLPKKIKEIGRYVFYGCDSLKTVVLPDNLKKIDNSAFWDCPSLQNFKISKKNKKFEVRGNCLIRKKNRDLVFAVTAGREFKVPDGVKRITSYAFGSSMSPAIHIPASVIKMEKAAFSMDPWGDNMNIKDVVVSENNLVFGRDGQCIYKKSDNSLAVAIADEKRELRISELVTKLTPDISLVNCDIFRNGFLEKVVYPSGLKYVTAPGFDVLRARNVYFTGSVPPEVSDPNEEGLEKLPNYCHVYVPEAYEEAYKEWYRKTVPYCEIHGWHTYNPETGI